MVRNQNPSYRERRAAIFNSGLALRQIRIAKKAARYEDLEGVKAKRAALAQANPDLQSVGGETGYVIPTATTLVDEPLMEAVRDEQGNAVLDAHGQPMMRPALDDRGQPLFRSRRVIKYAVDTALLGELNAIERSIAEEMGDLKDPSNIGGGTAIINVIFRVYLWLR